MENTSNHGASSGDTLFTSAGSGTGTDRDLVLSDEAMLEAYGEGEYSSEGEGEGESFFEPGDAASSSGERQPQGLNVQVESEGGRRVLLTPARPTAAQRSDARDRGASSSSSQASRGRSRSRGGRAKRRGPASSSAHSAEPRPKRPRIGEQDILPDSNNAALLALIAQVVDSAIDAREARAAEAPATADDTAATAVADATSSTAAANATAAAVVPASTVWDRVPPHMRNRVSSPAVTATPPGHNAAGPATTVRTQPPQPSGRASTPSATAVLEQPDSLNTAQLSAIKGRSLRTLSKLSCIDKTSSIAGIVATVRELAREPLYAVRTHLCSHGPSHTVPLAFVPCIHGVAGRNGYALCGCTLT